MSFVGKTSLHYFQRMRVLKTEKWNTKLTTKVAKKTDREAEA